MTHSDSNSNVSTEQEESTETTTPLTKKQKEWLEKAQDAADVMTPTISPIIKEWLSEEEFNNGYLMLSRLKARLRPDSESEFMRLSKEYFTLTYDEFGSMAEYLTHIKVLEERIDTTKVVLEGDKRTILCLDMSLPM